MFFSWRSRGSARGLRALALTCGGKICWPFKENALTFTTHTWKGLWGWRAGATFMDRWMWRFNKACSLGWVHTLLCGFEWGEISSIMCCIVRCAFVPPPSVFICLSGRRLASRKKSIPDDLIHLHHQALQQQKRTSASQHLWSQWSHSRSDLSSTL